MKYGPEVSRQEETDQVTSISTSREETERVKEREFQRYGFKVRGRDSQGQKTRKPAFIVVGCWRPHAPSTRVKDSGGRE
jgi:hypothetical protein